MKKHCTIFLTAVLLILNIFTIPIHAETETPTEEPTTEATIINECIGDTSTLPSVPAINAECCVVMDATTGTILYSKNGDAKAYPASITKVMSALVALENGLKLDDTITMSYDAVWGIERGSNHISLDVDEKITVEQCLYGMILESANEASLAIAEYIGGTTEHFAEMMNETAAKLGCTNSHFTNPNGLHDENHYTTAEDMATITRAAIQYPLYRTVSATQHYVIPPTNKQPKERNLWNQDKLIRSSSDYYYPYAEGGKTGFTDQARNTLVSYAKKNDVELICVIMKCPGAPNAYKDTIQLYDYFFDNYDYCYPLKNFNFYKESSENSNCIVTNFYRSLSHDRIELYTNTDYTVLAPVNFVADDISIEANYYEQPNEDTVGTLTLRYNEQTLGETPIHLQTMKVNAGNISWMESSSTKKIDIFKIILAILAILFVIFAFIFTLFLKNRRYRYLRRRRRNDKLHF